MVDGLLKRGWTDLTVLDLAPEALDFARQRLGERATCVNWIAADIARWRPTRTNGVWHDRAVFHFLTDPADRSAYREALIAALDPRSVAVLATFALDGPERCSALPVQRYSAETLARELGARFMLRDHWKERHITPAGAAQPFTWAAFTLN